MSPVAETTSAGVYVHCVNDCRFCCCVLHMDLVTVNLVYKQTLLASP